MLPTREAAPGVPSLHNILPLLEPHGLTLTVPSRGCGGRGANKLSQQFFVTCPGFRFRWGHLITKDPGIGLMHVRRVNQFAGFMQERVVDTRH